MGGSHLKPLSRSPFSQSRTNFASKGNRCKMWGSVGWNLIGITGGWVGGVFNTGTAECEPSRVSDLSVHISCTNSVSRARSDPMKRSETLVSMNPPSPPTTTTTTATAYLWWCISGISCSLSEWADWIDVFSLHDPFHTRRTNLCSLRGPFISL